VKHDEPLTERPAGPAGTGPQEARPADIPPGAVRFESTDVTTPSIAKALAVLIFVTVVVVALLLPMFGWLESRARRSDPPPPPMGGHQEGRLPAEPRLQTTPVQDLAAVRGQDERLLRSYGWVDEQKGIVRIPIDAAMQLIVQRGLPPAAAASPAPAPAASAVPSATASPGTAR
jgi:hypothetical protein